MSGPGGEEVGRVSIRVVPDTSGFRRELQNAVDAAEAGIKVTIPVEFDVDTAGLRAQLEALENSRVTIPVDIGDGSEIERLRARLQALDNSEVTIPVNLDLRDEARINAVLQRLRQRTININVRLHGVNQAIARLTALDALVRRLSGRQITINVDVDAGAAIAQIAAIEAALLALRGSLGSLSGSIGGAGGPFRSMAVQAAIALAILVAIPPLAAAIAVAGAAITAAWGGISTAIAAIGPAIFLLAAPIAAIALGMDGISKAAKTIKPEFDKLKQAVSSTFERKMIPVFQTLTKLFPTLQQGLINSASAVSFLAQSMANMLTSQPGIALIGKTFENINFALSEMHPGIESIVQGFLLLGAQTSIFDTLTQAVNTFGEEFRNSVIDSIADGSLDSAMRGLGESLAALSRGFTDLVQNGIKLFAAAAPGVNAAIDSITGFFNRFDWNSLGQSVGGVFQGIADGINSIPQETITGIEQAFAGLAETFQSAEFAQGIRDFATAAKDGIVIIDNFVKEFDEIAAGVQTAVGALATLSGAFENVAAVVESSSTAIREKWASALGLDTGDPLGLAALDDYMENKVRSIFGLPPLEAEKGGAGTAEGWEKGLGGRKGVGGTFGGPVEEGMDAVPPAFEQGLAPIPGVVTQGLTPAAAALAAALAQMPAIVQNGLAQLGPVAGAGMLVITQAITNGMGQLHTAVQTGFTNLAPIITAGMAQGAAGITAGTTAWHAAVIGGMNLIQSSVITGFAQVGAIASAGMLQVSTAITAGTFGWHSAVIGAMNLIQSSVITGFAQIGAIATAGMLQVSTAITAGTFGWHAAVIGAMNLIQSSVITGFGQLAAIATAGMLQVTTAITTGATGWTLAIGLAIQQLILTLTTGFTQMATLATLGMLQVQTAITTGVLGWQLAIQQGFLQMILVMQQGFLQMQVIAIAGMALFAQAILQGFALVVPAVQQGMLLIVTAVQLGFAQIVAAVIAGMAQVTAALQLNWATAVAATTAAMAQMVAVVTAAMAQLVAINQQGWVQMTAAVVQGTQQMVAAVTNGGNQMVAALQSAISRCVSILNAAVGQFRQAGVNMGAALAAGLESQVGRVQAAANRLAAAAAAATRAAAGIRSPSRVFIELGELLGQGLAVGMNQSELAVKRAAESMVDTVVSGVSGIDDALNTDAWAADFNARVNAELAAHDIGAARVAAGQKPVQVVQNFNVPSAERASDKASHGMRRLGALGLFGG